MTALRTAAKQALEALENGKRVRAGEGGTKFQIPLEDNAITALRAALAQQAEPVQEPVAFIHRQGNHWEVSERHLDEDEKDRGWTEEPLYTAPPQRKPLTNEEISKVAAPYYGTMGFRVETFARAVERALEKKNGR